MMAVQLCEFTPDHWVVHLKPVEKKKKVSDERLLALTRVLATAQGYSQTPAEDIQAQGGLQRRVMWERKNYFKSLHLYFREKWILKFCSELALNHYYDICLPLNRLGFLHKSRFCPQDTTHAVLIAATRWQHPDKWKGLQKGLWKNTMHSPHLNRLYYK